MTDSARRCSLHSPRMSSTPTADDKLSATRAGLILLTDDPLFGLHGLLEKGNSFWSLVERGLHHFKDILPESGVDRALEFLGLCLQFLILQRFLVGVAQGRNAVGRNIGRPGGQARDIALALHQRD